MCKGNCKCNKSEAGKLQSGHFWAWVKYTEKYKWIQRVVVDAEKRKFVLANDFCSYLDGERYSTCTYSTMTTTNPFKPVEMSVEEKAEVIREHFPKIMVRGENENALFRSIGGCDDDSRRVILSNNSMVLLKELKEYTLDLGQTVKKFEKESE